MDDRTVGMAHTVIQRLMKHLRSIGGVEMIGTFGTLCPTNHKFMRLDNGRALVLTSSKIMLLGGYGGYQKVEDPVSALLDSLCR